MSSFDPFGNNEQQIEELKRWAKKKRRQSATLIAIAVAAISVISSFYQIQPDEVGMVLRFGKHIDTTQPGAHFRLPFGIDRVIKVPIKRQLKMEFGFRTLRAGVQSEFQRTKQSRTEAEMLTGDLNVGTVEWIVQYKIASPEKYLFNFRDIEATLRLMAEATMRTVVGDHSIDELLTGGRENVEREGKKLLIELNKQYDTGIKIQHVKLQDVNAPDPVKPALRAVEEAKQERERFINVAWAQYNKVIPNAKGQAEQQIQEAEGYAIARINNAEGDAKRFNALYSEYRKAPEVTRTRLYLEALGETIKRSERKVFIDSNVKNLMPLLNLKGENK